LHLSARASESGAGIVYAPAPLPDELLYSWLARLAALNAGGAPREVLQQFFGCRTILPSVDLPTRLIAMEQRLGGLLPFTTLEELLELGTLLPYHRPFLTQASHSHVCQSLLHGNGKGLKTTMGRVANRFGANPALRSCPGCLADSWSHHGSLYWMRRHQLPGINCCTIHEIQLQSVPLQARTDRQRLLLPTTTQRTWRTIRADGLQVRFAQLSQDLVEASLPVLDPLQRATTYRDAALMQGYGSRRDRVDFLALADALRRRFNDFHGFDHQARLLATTAHPLGWLRPLFKKPQRSLHPICHLLLIEFLFGSVAAFKVAFAACEVAPHDPPAGAPPLVQSARVNTRPSALAITHEAELRDQSLSCRQVAAKIGWSVTTVVSWRRAHEIPIEERRKSLHPRVIDRILKAIGSMNSLRDVAAQTGVSLSSVYRILKQYPATLRPRQDAGGFEQVQLRRERWLAALRSSRTEQLGRVTDARSRASADYAWLYRHDRAWLALTINNSKQPVQHGNTLPGRVDWVRRDTEFCERLLQQLGRLRDEAPPQRLTKTRLVRPLGETMVRRNLGKLPQLDALLNKVTESAQAFGMRRVDYAIDLLVKEGKQLQLWRIQRLAGLRRWSSALTIHANQQIKRINAQNPLRPDGLP
jgi:hypothetical protein